MRKTKLIRGSTKRAIAVASAFMLTLSNAAGNVAVISAYAEETTGTENPAGGADEGNGGSEETGSSEEAGEGEGAGSGEEAGEGEGTGSGEETEEGEETGSGEENGEGEGAGSGEETGEGEGTGSGEETGEGEGAGSGEETGEGEGAGSGEETGEGEGAGSGEETGEGEGTGSGGETGEGEGAGSGEEAGEGEGTGNGEETGEGEGTGIGEETGKGEGTGSGEETGKGEETGGNEETGETGTSNIPEQDVIAEGDQQTTNGMLGNPNLMIERQLLTEENWYVSEYEKMDDVYYALNDAGERGEMLTNAYIDEKDLGFIIYVDKDGKMVKGKWLEIGDKFRYVDGKGKVKVGQIGAATGGYFGDFDEEGFWTPRKKEEFEDDLDDGTIVRRFSGDEGQILGIKKDQDSFYYTLIEEDGAWVCYLVPRKTNIKDENTERASNCWLGNYYIGADGVLVTDTKKMNIDGKFYNFGADGTYMLVINDFVGDGENKIYVGEDGTQVKGAFVFWEGRYIYIGEDGKQVFSEWIKEDGRFRYVNKEGNMVTNSTRVTKGYYGHFDGDGYWTAIPYEFCEMELEDGSRVRVYAEKEGKILKIAEKNDWRCCFETDENGIRCYVFDDKDEVVTKESVADLWLADLRADENGYLLTDVENRQIDGRFYCFDEVGHSTLVQDELIRDADGTILCYVDATGEIVKNGLVDYAMDTYYMDADGKPVTKQFVDTSEGRYYFGDDGKKVTDRFVTDGADTYYVDAAGKVVVNQFATCEGETFYFGEDGKKAISRFVEDAAGIYYVDETGVKKTDQLFTVGSDTYFADADGKLAVSQFAETGEGTYYFGSDGKLAVSQLVTDATGTYYVNADGQIEKNVFVTIDADTYYLDEEGHMATNQFVSDGTDEFYFGNDGKKVKNQFIKDGENTYYVDADGKKVASQFVEDATGTYYLQADGTLAVDQFVMVEDGTYYVDTDGRVVTNQFATYGGETFYFGNDGKKVTGQFVSDATGTYYVDADGRKITDQLVTDTTGSYYMGEDGRMAVSQFIAYDGHTLYFGEDGLQVFRRWISVGDRFRYVNGKGYMLVNTKKAAGGYYGSFDAEGYWTAIEDTFFEDELGDGTPVMKYAGKEGKVAGVDRAEERQHFGFTKDDQGALHCHLLAAGGESFTSEQVASRWIDDLWIDGNGVLCTDAKNVSIDQRYYNFDEYGHSSLVVTSLIYGEDGSIICYVGEDGVKVTDQFVTVGNKTLYFGSDGAQVFRKWISVGDKFRYVDGKGYMVVNAKKVAAGYYGNFDKDGYWTAIENTFFEGKLDDGTVIMKYSGKEGRVAGIGEVMAKRQQYGFLKGANGALQCHLLTEGGGALTGKLVTDTWMDDMRLDENGYLIVGTDAPVDGVFYRFDQDGHGTLITYSITYVMDGGNNSAANPTSYTGASDPIILETPSRAGYTFDGWYLDRSYGSRITEIAAKSHGDKTLYAKWVRNYSGSDNDSSDSDSGSQSTTTTETTGTTPETTAPGTVNAGGTSIGTVNTGSGEAAVTVTVGDGPNVTVQAGGTVVSATTAQTSAGSISGNTIISTAETAAVPLSDGQAAAVATIAVGADGSARTLLASPVQGATVQQTTIVVQGTEVVQNVVVYADGTQVAQKSGAEELAGFAATVVSAEAAIQSGSQTVAAVYNDKVDIDLNQYQPVGAPVTYEVTAGINGAVPQVQMEQTSFAPGQEIAALITDANGNVTAVTIVVGENGIIQYQIPGVNCIVRFMSKV